MTLDDLRRDVVGRSLFPPLSLPEALERLHFVQADPIRAPARAQDLILRQRVEGYRAGDLERAYPALDVEEDVFINYGFVSRTLSRLMHPRSLRTRLAASRRRRFDEVLAFVNDAGEVHPRTVDLHFAHGSVVNYWGGLSKATTRLLEDMQYRGILRVARRERGIRIYAARPGAAPPSGSPAATTSLDTLIDMLIRLYAPVPGASVSPLIRRLRYGVPQWRDRLPTALRRARARLRREVVNGSDWFWPEDTHATNSAGDERVRLLAPFDPVVWDRRRFELLWGWAYRFEAYTPVAKRKLGYYALPLLWRDRVIGWGNCAVVDGALDVSFGYIAREPRDRTFRRELEAEAERLRRFLDLDGGP